MIPLYTSYIYARSNLERAFLEIGQFAHVSEKQMAAAFDDVEAGTAEPFSYTFPPPSGRGKNPWDDFAIDYDWTCSQAYTTGPLVIHVERGFAAEPMARLIHHRHGILCQICMNPTAKYTFKGRNFGLANPLHIGRTYDGGSFPDICEGCLRLAQICVMDFEGLAFLKAARKELRKTNSPLVERLRKAPRLRFEPRYRYAA